MARKYGVNPSYQSWSHMKQRCLNPKNDRWKDYGGRGIKMCPEWISFYEFYADMGERPLGTSLERRDLNGPYDKDNCYWATPRQQQNNTRLNKKYDFRGESLTCPEIARRIGINKNTLRLRIFRGWSVEEAISRTVVKRKYST
jgi:hypothetical protein